MEKSGCLGVIKVFSFFLFFLIVFCLAGSTGLCFHNDDFRKDRDYTRREGALPRSQGGYAGGHDTITGEAALLKTDVHKRDADGGKAFSNWLYRRPEDALTYFRTGAHDEDTLFPFYNDPPAGPNGWGYFFEHFYNPATDSGLLGMSPSALDRADMFLYYLVKRVCSTNGFDNLPPDDKNKVLDDFGRIMHLIQDMAVPSHVKDDPHPLNNPFEDYVRDHWDAIVTDPEFLRAVTLDGYLSGAYAFASLDPREMMRRLARYASRYPDNEELYVSVPCRDNPGEMCREVNEKALKEAALALVPAAINFSAGYMDQVYDNLPNIARTKEGSQWCYDWPIGDDRGKEHPDDRLDVSDEFYWERELGITPDDLLNRYMRTALKKGKVGVLYKKEITRFFYEAKEKYRNAPQNVKDEVEKQFRTLLMKAKGRNMERDWKGAPDIAVFAHGYFRPALSLLLKINEMGRFVTYDFDPAIVADHPVLFIPSGSLSGMDKSQRLKAKLDEYVKSGGTLVVLAQEFGSHYELLPAPVNPATGEAPLLSGYGYQQDQNCQFGSVIVEEKHPVLSGFTSSTGNVGVDGYFTSIPYGAKVLLRRTTNGYPALVVYPYGKGYVIAGAVFTDWALTHGQATAEEINLVANILAWAKKPADLPSVRENETISGEIPVHNFTGTSASSVLLTLYTPDRSKEVTSQKVSVVLPPGGTGRARFTFPFAGLGPGIYHVDYTLLDGNGTPVQPPAESDEGRFVGVVPLLPGQSGKEIYFFATAAAQQVPFGAPMVYTFHVRNTGSTARNLTIRGHFRHTWRNRSWNVTARPGMEEKVSGSDPYTDTYSFETLTAYLYDEQGQAIGSSDLTFTVLNPDVGVAVTTDKTLYAPGETVRIESAITNNHPYPFDGTVRLLVTDPANSVIYEEEKALSLAGKGLKTDRWQFPVAAGLQRGYFSVRAEVVQGGNVVSWGFGYFELPAARIRLVAPIPDRLTAGAVTVPATLVNEGPTPIADGRIGLSLREPDGTVIHSRSLSYTLGPLESKVIGLPVVFPDLVFGTYTLVVDESNETGASSPLQLALVNGLAIDSRVQGSSVMTGRPFPVSVSLINTGIFDLPSVRLAVTAFGATESAPALSIPVRQTVQATLPVTAPGSVGPGSQDVTLEALLPSGSVVREKAQVTIPRSSLTVLYRGPETVRAGDPVDLLLENTGGVDTEFFSETIELTDSRGFVADRIRVDGTIRAGETVPLGSLSVPGQVAGGSYYVTAVVSDGREAKRAVLKRTLSVSGLVPSIRATTTKEIYKPNEVIGGVTEIATGDNELVESLLTVSVETSSPFEDFSHYLPRSGWAPVNAPRSVAAGPDGSVYVSDPLRPLVQKYDSDGNLIRLLGRNEGGNDEITAPADLAVDGRGNIHVLDMAKKVVTLSPDGTILQTFALKKEEESIRSGGHITLAVPGRLAVSPDGSIFVTTGGHRIQKYSSLGVHVISWGADGRGNGQFSWTGGVAVGPDGTVYVVDVGNDRVQYFDGNGRYQGQWGGRGAANGLMNSPDAISVDGDGTVRLTDRGNGRIQAFSPGGGFVSAFGSRGSGHGQFSLPQGLAAGPDGVLYVADTGNGRIQKMTIGGTFLRSWSKRDGDEGRFDRPSKVAADREGNIYVADTGNDRIQKFDREGRFVMAWGTTGSGEGRLSSPGGIQAAADGSIFVADSGNNRIQVFTGDGLFVSTFGHEGFDDEGFNEPADLCIGTNGLIYIADKGNNRIQVFDGTGLFQQTWEAAGDGGRFSAPAGVGCGKDGSVYVTDGLERVQKFTDSGEFVLQWGEGGFGDGQFFQPSGIVVSDDAVYVVDTGHSRIQKFDLSGNFLRKWGTEEGDDDGMFTLPEGVGMTTEGLLLVADTGNGRIQKMGMRTVRDRPGTIFVKTSTLSQPARSTVLYKEDITLPAVEGKLYFVSLLSNSLGQELGRSFQPFYISRGNMITTVDAGRSLIKAGDGITLSGETRNENDFPLTGLAMAMVLTGPSGPVTVLEDRFDLAAGERRPVSVTVPPPPPGPYTVRATVSAGTTVLQDVVDRFDVAGPSGSVTMTAPETVGDDPFDVTVEIENRGKVPYAVQILSRWDGAVRQVITAPGAKETILFTVQITRDTDLVLAYSGDGAGEIVKTVHYGPAWTLTVAKTALYREGRVSIPFQVSNRGPVDGTLSVTIGLTPGTIRETRHYTVAGGMSVGDTFSVDLGRGTYDLTVDKSAGGGADTVRFEVLGERKASLDTVTVGAPVQGSRPVTVTVTNRGYGTFEGSLTASIGGTGGSAPWLSSLALSLPFSDTPVPQPFLFSIPGAMIPPGSAEVVVELKGSDGAVMAVQRRPVESGGDGGIVLSAIPPSQTVKAGDDALFIFAVANRGSREGLAEFTALSHDFVKVVRKERLQPGDVREIQVGFSLPADLEAKTYSLSYELGTTGTVVARGQVAYEVAGVALSVGADLDKKAYSEGETARLTLTVDQPAGSGPNRLFARVAYGTFESRKDITVDGRQTVTFDIPLTRITGEKLFYGLYTMSGRSVHMNSLFVAKKAVDLTITTDRQVYRAGDTMTVRIDGTKTGTVTLTGPGGLMDTFSFSGSLSRTFTLPEDMASGTYAVFATLATSTGETIGTKQAFDVAGISVKVKEAFLSKGAYGPTESLRFTVRAQSTVDLSASLRIWVRHPDGKSEFLAEKAVALTKDGLLDESSTLVFTRRSAGVHSIVYGIYKEWLLLASGTVAFDSGDVELLSVGTDRRLYAEGTGPVEVSTGIFAAGPATVTLLLNGQAVESKAAGGTGFSTMTFALHPPGQGTYVLKATITGTGMESSKETSFVYGGSRPDLTVAVGPLTAMPDRDGMTRISLAVSNSGGPVTGPFTISLYEKDVQIGSSVIDGIPGGRTVTADYPWNAMGRAGVTSFRAVVDEGNAVAEGNEENNSDRGDMTVPEVILFSDLEGETFAIGDLIRISSLVVNLTASTSFPAMEITTSVFDGAGSRLYTFTEPIAVAPSSKVTYDHLWNSSNLPSTGSYTMVQTVSAGGKILARADRPVTFSGTAGFVLDTETKTHRVNQGGSVRMVLSVKPVMGWTGQVFLSAAGLADGMTATIVPDRLVPPGEAVVTVTVAGNGATGPATVVLAGEGAVGAGSGRRSLAVTVDVAGFTVQAKPGYLTVKKLTSGDVNIETRGENGYTGTVRLDDMTGPVKGVRIDMEGAPVPVPSETKIRVVASKLACAGLYDVRIRVFDGLAGKTVTIPTEVVENEAMHTGFVVTPGAGPSNISSVVLISGDGEKIGELVPFDTKYGANAVLGDVDGDGDDEVIVAPGPDARGEAVLCVLKKDGTLIAGAKIFDSLYGLNVAVADIDGDWVDEIIVATGSDPEVAPRVKVLAVEGTTIVDTGVEFEPFPKERSCSFYCPQIKAGATVAAGDVDGDGTSEIITGAGPYYGNPSRITVHQIDTSGGPGQWKVRAKVGDFTVNFTGGGMAGRGKSGVNVAAGDVDGDGMAEIIAGAGPSLSSRPVVKIFKGDGTYTGVSFEAYTKDLSPPAGGQETDGAGLSGETVQTSGGTGSGQTGYGVTVAAGDLDGDGVAEIITGPGPGRSNKAWVRVFRGDGTVYSKGFLAYPASVGYGVKASSGNVGPLPGDR